MKIAAPYLLFLSLIGNLGLLGCPVPVEGFEAELHFITPENQDPLQDIQRLEITFEYTGDQPLTFLMTAPFPTSQDLDDLPPTDEAEVRVSVAGQVTDSASPSGWQTVALGSSYQPFAMPPEDDIEIYFAMRGQIAELRGGLARPRSDGIAVLLPDGRVAIIGGIDEDGPVAEIETLFDGGMDLTAEVTGTTHDDLPRVAHGAYLVQDSGTDLEGKVVIVGGDTGCPDFYCSPVVNEVEDVVVFDPDSNSTDVLGEMDTPTVASTVVELTGGRLGITGGFQSGTTSDVYVGDAQIFDPYDDDTVRTEDLDAREQHTATLLDDGTVLVAGGYGPAGAALSLLDTAEIWEPEVSIGDAGPLVEARFRHTATLLHDSTVLIAGGATGQAWDAAGQGMENAELYNPTTGFFEPLGDIMNHARQRHIAMPTGDDLHRILICGGVLRAADNSIDTCEYYDPQQKSFESLDETRLLPGGGGMMAVTLKDGRILMMGGMNDGEARGEIYLYQP